MLLKKSIFLLALLIATAGFAQTKEQTIALLNNKARETDNNIKIVNKVSYELKESAISTSNAGVVYNFKFGGGKSASAYSYEFDPSDITSVEDLYMDKESPIGVLRLKFDESVVRYKTGTKKPDETDTYVNYVNIQYLKIDNNNYSEIKKAFMRLKDLYSGTTPAQVTSLSKKMARYTEFWFGGDGTSRTYKLRKIYYTGCTLKIFYDYKEISAKSKSEFTTYMTIVPLSEVDDIELEKTKSKPNCIMFEHGGKGFETFVYSGSDVYKPSAKQKQLPSFIDVTKSEDLTITEQYIKDAVKNCGGGKVKL